MKNEVKVIFNTLKGINKRLPWAIHESYGIDWNAPMITNVGTIPFTAKKVIPDYVINNRDYRIIVLAVGKNNSCVVPMIYKHGNGKLNLDNDERIVTIDYETGIRTFYKKSDYEDVRKGFMCNSGLPVYVIAQKRDLLSRPRKYRTDPQFTTNERYFVQNVYFYGTWGRSERYIYRIDVLTEQNKEAMFSLGGKDGVVFESDVFDKSGYCVGLCRAELVRRATRLRKEWEENSYKAIDNTSSIDYLEKVFEITKGKVLDYVRCADTWEEYDKSSDLFGYGGLKSARRLIDQIRDTETHKMYASQENFLERFKECLILMENISKKI